MDTFITIYFWGKDSEKAKEICWKKLEELDQKLNRFNPQSEVYKINKKAGDWIEVSKEVEDVLKEAKYYAQISEGLFDPTIGPLMELWGFYNGSLYIPNDKELKEALSKVNWKDLEISEGKVRLKRKGMSLDLGGIAKGYAVQRLLEISKNLNLQRVYLDIGGTIGVYGKPLKGDYWIIGIKHPRKEGRIIGKIKIKSGVVATSGDYERFFVNNGKRYPHIINPKTGIPSSEIMSVTIISKNGITADALSTLFFVLGERGKDLWKSKFRDVGVIIVEKDGKIWKSDNIYFEEEK
ncbi:MAG: FAD:protein FMN transferase [Dictyoglomus sp.]|nr:FAD:protein FMN transferase [Dictyoglomus sp.]MCX7845007.1 FAD:protein FMN transferase [Dictyoglomaceae bacterium]MDW8187744.1 FAD:protein FMN transferase [Dictyoglomus sp.]